MNGITSSTALWYSSRATGVVSLVLLSAVMVIGILVNRQGRLPGLPRFAVLGLHRNLSLLAVAFVALHVITAVADSFVSISLAAAVIPFVSAYEPLWLGLGAVSLDLMAAIAGPTGTVDYGRAWDTAFEIVAGMLVRTSPSARRSDRPRA